MFLPWVLPKHQTLKNDLRKACASSDYAHPHCKSDYVFFLWVLPEHQSLKNHLKKIVQFLVVFPLWMLPNDRAVKNRMCLDYGLSNPALTMGSAIQFVYGLSNPASALIMTSVIPKYC